MNRSVRVLACGVALVLLLAALGCSKLQARDQLNKGVQSFKNAKYEEAIEHFNKSVSLDPTLLTARLYLATAYAQQYIPGADTPENNRNAEQAIAEFQKVLDLNPPKEQKVHSLKGIASLYFSMKKMPKAKEYYEKVAQLDPNDPEVYYSIAVIDWTQSYQPRMEARARLGLQPAEPLKDKKVCEQLRGQVLNVVEDGMKKLDKALQLRPEYDDAMAYMNLLYREKADLECGDPAAAAQDRKLADEWNAKVLPTRQAREAKKGQAGGIVLDQNK